MRFRGFNQSVEKQKNGSIFLLCSICPTKVTIDLVCTTMSLFCHEMRYFQSTSIFLNKPFCERIKQKVKYTCTFRYDKLKSTITQDRSAHPQFSRVTHIYYISLTYIVLVIASGYDRKMFQKYKSSSFNGNNIFILRNFILQAKLEPKTSIEQCTQITNVQNWKKSSITANTSRFAENRNSPSLWRYQKDRLKSGFKTDAQKKGNITKRNSSKGWVLTPRLILRFPQTHSSQHRKWNRKSIVHSMWLQRHLKADWSSL